MIVIFKWIAGQALKLFKWLGLTGTLITLSLLASGLLVGYSMWSAGRTQKALATSEKALKQVTDDRDQLRANSDANYKASKAVTAARVDITNKEAIGRAETEQALQNNLDWANQPVPADVLASLRR